MNNTKSLGFIILRNVNNAKTNEYWVLCYNCIRKYYPENHILIIDDDSNKEYLENKDLYKTTVINTEYPRRGELLPYYYYLRNRLFDVAVIIHDSVFINKYIDFSIDKYKFIWTFQHDWDQVEDETDMINVFNDKDLLDFYHNKKLWEGCFGAMSIISYEYLETVHKKYNIDLLLDKVVTRYNRCSFERVIGVLLQFELHLCTFKTPLSGVVMNGEGVADCAFEMRNGVKQQPLLGNIHEYCIWKSIRFNNKDKYNHLPIIKVWTGR